MVKFSFKMCFFLLLIIFSSNCTKKEIAETTDLYIEAEEQLETSSIQINSVGLNFIEFEWKPVTSSTFKKIEYDVYQDDRLIMSGITAHVYTFINLEEGKEYAIKVVARSQSSKETQILSKAKTLAQETVISNTFYKEFQLFGSTSLTGFTVTRKLQDEGHIITRLLQHPSRYEYDSFKLVTFRLDRMGNVLWYRLLSINDYPVDFYSAAMALNENLNQAIIVSGKVLWKIDIVSGKNIEIKDLKKELDEDDRITSVRYSTSHELLLGTSSYKLLKLDFQSLSIVWKRNSDKYHGVIKSITVDSKGFIYFIFSTDDHTIIQVHKANSDGEFIKAFTFDGKLQGDYEPNGYGMDFIAMDKEDNFYLFGKNYYNFSLRYFKFDTEGNVLLKQNEYTTFQPSSGFFDKDGNLILYGFIQGYKIDFTSYINKYDKSMKMLKSITYPDLPMYAIHSLTQNNNGSFNIFLHYATTYTYENHNFVFIRTHDDGTL